MAFLEQFSEDEIALIVSVPYRVGIWVSRADESGGAVANHKEMQTLKKIIDKQARGMFESAFVHEVMAELYVRQQHWEEWQENMDTVVDECAKASQIVGAKMLEKDAAAYRHNVMTIARAVAHAYREFDENTSALARHIRKISIAFDDFLGRLKGVDYESERALNISVEEDIVLTKLAETLYGEDAQISQKEDA